MICMMPVKLPLVAVVTLILLVASSSTLPQSCKSGTSTNLTSVQCNSHSEIGCTAFKSSNGSLSFSCDEQKLCSNSHDSSSDQGTRLYTTKQHNGGWLFCCREPGCNTLEAVKGALSTLKCYVTNLTDNTISLKTCRTAWCIRRKIADTSPDSGVSLSPYSCDNHNLCDRHVNLTDNCTAVPVAPGLKLQEQFCCCSTDGCNYDNAGVHTQQSPTMTPTSTLPPQLSPMPPNPSQDNKNAKHMIFVGGIIAACMFGILVFIVVAIVIRRYRQKSSSQLTYTYTQLTEDLAEERNADDDRMLVG